MAKRVKRERCINWEKEEKRLLREVIKPFIHIVENKDISTKSNKAKINAWMEITDRFNRVNKRIRDKKQLRNQWKISKNILKREISQYRRQRSQIGVGLKPPSPGPDRLEVIEMVPQKLEIDYNEFDCNVKKENDRINPDSQPAPSASQPLPNQFNFGEASYYEDVYKLRILENERQLREHECRMKSMAEIHNQIMINLKLQEEMFKIMLEKCST